MKKSKVLNLKVENNQTRFHAMTEASKEQWEVIAEKDKEYTKGLPDWILAQLNLLRDECHGFAIDRLEHSLQAATRAFRDGREDEYVVCALVHDLGSLFAPQNHGEVISLIMAPYISEKNRWMLEHHTAFQKYYFAEFFGGNKNIREKYKEHPFYHDTIEFCHLYDQMSFNPDYKSMSLKEFEPLLRKVLNKPKSK